MRHSNFRQEEWGAGSGQQAQEGWGARSSCCSTWAGTAGAGGVQLGRWLHHEQLLQHMCEETAGAYIVCSWDPDKINFCCIGADAVVVLCWCACRCSRGSRCRQLSRLRTKCADAVCGAGIELY